MRELLEQCRKRLAAARRKPDFAHLRYHRPVPAYWVLEKGGEELAWFPRFLDVLREGRVVWGAPLTANEAAYREDDHLDLPGHLVWSQELVFSSKPDELRAMAQALHARSGDEANADAIDVALRSGTGVLRNAEVTSAVSRGKKVFCASFFALRAHLPGRHLQHRFFPCVATPGPDGGAVVLPGRYWAPELFSATTAAGGDAP